MPYLKLLLTLCISFVIMYAVMFLNVDDTNHIYLSITRAYMALLMVAPMAIVMLLAMGNMYPNKKLNYGIMALSTLAIVVVTGLLRLQTFIGDKAYMQAMIPHHSSAILTSKHAHITDPEVKALSEQIIQSQEKEIKQMKAILKRM